MVYLLSNHILPSVLSLAFCVISPVLSMLEGVCSQIIALLILCEATEQLLILCEATEQLLILCEATELNLNIVSVQ
jgi:hypothetical protein